MPRPGVRRTTARRWQDRPTGGRATGGLNSHSRRPQVARRSSARRQARPSDKRRNPLPTTLQPTTFPSGVENVYSGCFMATHDPQRFIELLRDHLAAHDKRLLFLLGAGTSCSINVAPAAEPGRRRGFTPLIPAIDALTVACKEAVDRLSDRHSAAWHELIEECRAMDLAPHIENVLGRLRRKVDAAGPGQGALGLEEAGLQNLEETIRATIAEQASPEEAVIPNTLPHDSLATWVRYARRRHPIEIFTTNYDVLIERSLERTRVPLFDGFVGSYEPYFSPDGIERDESMPGYEWARLWKLHGSINWELRTGSVVRVSSSMHGEMILPSHRKYDESRKFPYLSLIDRLGRCLAVDGTLLITCGYSWNDEHINAVILSALKTIQQVTQLPCPFLRSTNCHT